MILNKQIPFLEKRMSFQNMEFDYLKDTYRNIAFNCKHWDGKPNIGKYLYATEGYITIPKNYDINYVKNNFQGLITPNSKFKKLFGEQIEIQLVNGPGYYNNFWIFEKEDFVDYKNKIHGLCALNNIYRTNSDGDIVKFREPIFNNITIENFEKHSYGKQKWGGENYKGHPSKTPSSPENLKIISKYKFCLCLEPMYHELWSYDWLTERLLDCFKVKTIPIYWGCYNIEEKVPKELYVDLRKYRNINEAILTVKDIGEDEYNKITDLANQFYNDCKIGNILEIEEVLRGLN